MLEHDRKNCERRNSGPYPWHAPLFQSPFEKRRLKIINAIGKAVGKLGGDLQCGRVDPGVFHAVFGATSVPFSVDDKSNVANYQRPYYQEPDRSDTEPLVLQSRAYVGDGRREPRQWQDSKDTKLEEQLTEIAVSLAVDAEAAARYAVERRRAGLLERRREIVEKRRKEHDAVILAARAEARRFVKLTYQKLLSEARRYSQAQEIRAYVEAASDAVGAGLDGLEEWRSWALAQADAIDPVLGGAFLRPVEFAPVNQVQGSETGQKADPSEQSSNDEWHPNRHGHYHRGR